MSAPRALVIPAFLLWLAAAFAACGAIEDEPPPRNPLADTATPATATATPSPTPTAGADEPGSPDGPPDPALAESTTGRGLELLAEWLGINAQDIAVVTVEPVVWPDACLGVEQPGLLCAQVLTPGFRMLFRDALGGLHAVHAEPESGNARWVGEVQVEGTLTAVDTMARRVTLEVDGAPLELRLAPGTQWLPADAESRAAGQTVVAAYDPAGTSSGVATAAWIALEAP